MKETLKVGLEHVHTYRVPENKTVPYLYPEAKAFQEMPKVFATGYMVGLMEWACIEAMAPHMEPGEGSVGTLVNVTHTAATPPGMTVTVRVRCIGVEGRRTVWDIEAKDDVEVIGRGTTSGSPSTSPSSTPAWRRRPPERNRTGRRGERRRLRRILPPRETFPGSPPLYLPIGNFFR